MNAKPVARWADKWWAVKMLFVWRWRCGYWDWAAFRAMWRAKPYVLMHTVGLFALRQDLARARKLLDTAAQCIEQAIYSDDGLDGGIGERVLQEIGRELGWPGECRMRNAECGLQSERQDKRNCRRCTQSPN